MKKRVLAGVKYCELSTGPTNDTDEIAAHLQSGGKAETEEDCRVKSPEPTLRKPRVGHLGVAMGVA